jgi:hypothetical protein
MPHSHPLVIPETTRAGTNKYHEESNKTVYNKRET